MADIEYETDRVLFFDSFDQDIFQNEPLQEVVSSLRGKLLKAIKDGKWVLFEFNPKNADDRIKWTKKMSVLCVRSSIPCAKLGVLGDKSKIITHMRSIRMAQFAEAGAVPELYDGDKLSLNDALKEWDQKILDTDNARKIRNAKLSEASA